MTPQQPGRPAQGASDATRYVVQHHTGGGGRDHFDLMLQRGDVLWTWQLETMPGSGSAGRPPEAVRIADHRLAYLTYEGPISGSRGRCRIVDSGQVRWLAVDADRVVVELSGGALAGRFDLPA